MNIWVSSGLTFYKLEYSGCRIQTLLGSTTAVEVSAFSRSLRLQCDRPQSCLQIIVVNAGTGAVMLQRQF